MSKSSQLSNSDLWKGTRVWPRTCRHKTRLLQTFTELLLSTMHCAKHLARFILLSHNNHFGASQVALVVKNPPANAGNIPFLRQDEA